MLRILFFSSSALPGVCVHIYIYIYYKYQRNYISILGREDEGGTCAGAPTLSVPQTSRKRGDVTEVFLFPTAPALGPSSHLGPSTQRWWWCCCVVRKDTQGEEGRGRVRRGGRLSPVTGGGGVVRRAWWSSSNNTGVAPPSWGRGGRAGFFSGPLKALLPRSHS